MKRFKLSLFVAATGLLLLALVATWPEVARAFNPQPEPPAFVSQGLARFQTARLNLANLAQPPDPTQPPDPAMACNATLGLLDSNGQLFTDSSGAPVMARVSVLPGQSAFLDLRSTDAFRNSNALRVQFRGHVDFQPPDPAQPPDPCRLALPSLEVFDNFTGRTSMLYVPPAPFSLPPDPQAPPR